MSADDQRLINRIAQVAEPFDLVDHLPLESMLQRIGDSRVVLMGEASHGTSEFYRASHYFQAELPRQFDEYIWINHSRARGNNIE